MAIAIAAAAAAANRQANADKWHWRDLQEMTFLRWVNEHLAKRGMHIENLVELKDGLSLINLVEVLSEESVGRYNKHPRIAIQKQENVSIALEFIKAQGIRLVNVGTQDIISGNLRIILGLVWSLIGFYELQTGEAEGGGAGDELLEWVRSKIPEYNIQNFTSDWNDGRAICALVNALSPGAVPDHREKATEAYKDMLGNATEGIDKAWSILGVDKLVMPDEMVHPKVDRLALMTYIAQFRNLSDRQAVEQKPEEQVQHSDKDEAKPEPEPPVVKKADLCKAYGPGLVEVVAGNPGEFIIECPPGMKGKLSIRIHGPQDSDAKADVKKVRDGVFRVIYTPKVPGVFDVVITVDGEHIPGSIFHPNVLEDESLGGEGKIRVYYTTTTSSKKTREDIEKLEELLKSRNIHLREDFEPWEAVDIMDPKDRDAVFRKAGTRDLPIVFIDDKYVGDYDRCLELSKNGELDKLLNMNKSGLVSEEEHMKRLRGIREKDPMSDWSCPVCTLINPWHLRKCAGCELANPNLPKHLQRAGNPQKIQGSKYGQAIAYERAKLGGSGQVVKNYKIGESREYLTEEKIFRWIEVGMNVLVKTGQGVLVGKVKWKGRAHFSDGLWIGIELKEPKGRHNGSFEGHGYFTCKDKHGIFSRPENVLEEIKDHEV